MPTNQNPPIRKLVIFIGLLWLFNTEIARAEKADTIKIKESFVVSSYAQYGEVLATNPYLKLANTMNNATNEFAALSFQLLKQTTGAKIWEQKFGYPCYGLGIYSASFFNNQLFGTPIALYGVFKAPFK